VRREEELQRVDPGAAASIPCEKGEGAGEIYFFQLLHLSQLSLSAFCGDFFGSDGGAVPGSAAASASADPPPRDLAKGGASSRCSTKAVAPLWERLCPKAKRYLSA